MAREKRILSIRAALEWAFVNECATLDLDEGPAVVNVSTEYLLMQRAKLGGVRVDTSGGRSLPHDDADRLASIVTNTLTPDMARRVYDHARTGLFPDWMPGAVAKIVPRAWNTKSRHGLFGKTEILASFTETFEVAHPRNPERTITRRRKVVIEYVPCTWEVHPQEIRSARADYASWWDALAAVKQRAQSIALGSIEISDEMPPYQPWR